MLTAVLQKFASVLSLGLVAVASAVPLFPGQPIVPGLLAHQAAEAVVAAGLDLNSPLLAHANSAAERQVIIEQLRQQARELTPGAVDPVTGLQIGASGAVGPVAPSVTNLQL